MLEFQATVICLLICTANSQQPVYDASANMTFKVHFPVRSRVKQSMFHLTADDFSLIAPIDKQMGNVMDADASASDKILALIKSLTTNPPSTTAKPCPVHVG